MSDIDRTRAARLMQAAEIEALVVSAPEAFRYITGARPGVAALFRRAGAALAVLPADPGAPLAAIVTDLAEAAVAAKVSDTRTHPMWAETMRYDGPQDGKLPDLNAAMNEIRDETHLQRPETFDVHLAFQHLRDVLSERGLSKARIGLDLDSWPVADFRVLQSVLPEADLVDASPVLDRLRAVKTSREIACLSEAGLLAEAGVQATLSLIKPGMTRAELADYWSKGVTQAAMSRKTKGLESRWEYIAFGPNPWAPDGELQPGEIIKFDVGTVVDGYSSDSARTFVLGPPRPLAQDIHDALLQSFAAGLEKLRPGQPLSAVHGAATTAIRRAGLATFTRGHFGHGVGMGVFGEMWPFLSANVDALAEPGMVLAFETPLYVDGVGGFIIEDQVLITETGAEPLWSLPHDLVSIPV